jgi:hypothetical protein
MVRDGQVDHSPALVGDDDQDEQQAAGRGRHDEEIGRHDCPT